MTSKELRDALELLEKHPWWEIQEIFISQTWYSIEYPINYYGIRIYNYKRKVGFLTLNVTNLKVWLEAHPNEVLVDSNNTETISG